MAVVFVCGIECATGEHWTSSTGAGAPSVDTTIFRTGTRSRKIVTSANTYQFVRATGTSGTVACARFYLYIDTIPNATVSIARFNNTGLSRFSELQMNSSGQVRCRSTAVATSTNGTFSSALSTGQWYRIDLRSEFSSSNVLTDAQIDGTSLDQAAQSSGVADTNDDFRFGIFATNSTATMYFDDFVVNDSDEYPIGPGFVRHYFPGSDGAHNVGSATFVRSGGGGTITDSTTNVYTYLDDRPDANTDFIDQETIDTTHYIEVNYEDSTDFKVLKAVDFVWRDANGSGAANNYELHVLDDTGDVTLYDGTTFGTAGGLRRAIRTTAPNGGAWSRTAWNLVKARFGYSSDITPAPRLHSLMAEVDFRDTTEGISGNQIIMLG